MNLTGGFRVGFAFLVVAFAPAFVPAATLTRMNVVPDGSARPPGDIVEVEVLFSPGEKEVTLEVRAFRVEEGRKYKATPIPSQDPAARDGRGNYLLKSRLASPEEGRVAKATLVVPYAHLKLGKGMHGMAYEVTGLIEKDVQFVRASPVSYVIVSNKVRTEMNIDKETVNVAPGRVKREINIIKEGKFTTVDAEIEAPELKFDFSSEQVKVRIPGEFQRPLMAKGAAFQRDENDGAPWDALPLDHVAWESLDKFEPKSKRTILFATSRTVANAKVFKPERYGMETSARVTYGTALINIPVETHQRGQMETPGWWQGRDPRKHFLVESLGEFSAVQFQKAVSGRDCLLFIHGYNNNFEFVVLRTAQLVHDLQFPGQGVSFIWPSAGSVSGYFHDETESAKSVPALVEVLENLISASPAGAPRKIHVIAHSMGNRVFMNAVRQLELKRPKSSPFLGQVALAAPDVDGASFAALLPSVQRMSEHVTLYYCSDDQALKASRTVHQDKPVGLGPWFAEGLDTINSDNANTEMLGHGYYASSHPLLLDLRLLLVFGDAADKRLPPLTTKTMVLGYPHWAFSPQR